MGMKRLMWLLGAVLVVGGLAVGCGGDDEGADDASSADGGTESGDSESAGDTEATGDSTVDTGADGSGEATIESYCDAVHDYVDAYEAFIADPSSGDSQELGATGADLVQQYQQLSSQMVGSEAAAREAAGCAAEATETMSAMPG